MDRRRNGLLGQGVTVDPGGVTIGAPKEEEHVPRCYRTR
jgi:hypothetical protein